MNAIPQGALLQGDLWLVLGAWVVAVMLTAAIGVILRSMLGFSRWVSIRVKPTTEPIGPQMRRVLLPALVFWLLGMAGCWIASQVPYWLGKP